MQIDSIEADIVAYVGQLKAKAQRSGWTKDRQWTQGINADFCDIGHKYGCKVYASYCQNADGPGWLYDHIWWSSEPNCSLTRVPLAMEIEWGFGARGLYEKVLEDFLKLVQARADLRVMVFQGNDINGMIDRLIGEAKCFSAGQSGDRYIFAGWEWGTEEMELRQWRR